MSWEPEVNELRRRAAMAREMGGPDAVAFHKGRGKLTVRERIDLLGDAGTFQETGVLAGRPEWDGDRLASLTPANSVTGVVRIDGRKVVVHGGDFTIRGGAADAAVADKSGWAVRHAYTHRIPLVRLLDATGGSVRTFESLGRTYLPTNERVQDIELLHMVPVVSAVLGSVAGLPAVQAAQCHFNVMVKGTSQVFVAGPAVVKAGLGVDITKEELGNEDVQVRQSGVIANLAENEEDALGQIRRFLSYLPSNVWEMPPRSEPTDAPDRREEELISIVPRDRRRVYDPHRIVELVLDRGSWFEIQPEFGRARITGLARVNGYPVGVMINNPRYLGGSMDKAAGEKTARLVQLCDTFHLPLVYFCDEPGFMVGLEEEKKGIVRAGARIVSLVSLSRMPYITFIVRQVYGVAGGLHARGGDGMYRRYAWPSGHWGSMHIEGGVAVAYRREIEAAPDPQAKRAEIEARMEALRSPFRTAHAFAIEDIIDPRDTRPLLVDFVEDAQPILRSQLGMTSRIPYLP
ncbi:MAG: propionyl-CoA carboxylase subunit beta [Dehalococcoidia bacterium]